MGKLLDWIIKSLVKRIPGSTKESVGSNLTTIDLVRAYLNHRSNSKAPKGDSKLVAPNQTILFPLPDRWTNTPNSLSFQAIYLFVMQATYSGVSADRPKSDIIKNTPNKSLVNLELMNNLRFTSVADSKTVHKIASMYFLQLFRYAQDTIYNLQKEVVVGESIVNGENPFLLRKFNGKVKEY